MTMLSHVEEKITTESEDLEILPVQESPSKNRALLRLSELRADILWLGPVLVLVTMIASWNLNNYPARFDDEGTYVSQAWSAVHLTGLAPYTYWYDHPPLGWIQIGLWTELVGTISPDPHAIGAGREFMVLLGTLSAYLVYLIGRRLQMSRPAAVASVLLLSLSPLALEYRRMVFLDNVAIFWTLAAIACVLSPRRHLKSAALAGLCFGIAILSKATALLFFPVIVWVLARNFRGSNRGMAQALLWSVSGIIGATFVLFAVLRGELIPGADHVSLVEALRFQLGGRSGSGSVFDPTTAGGSLVRNWLRLDPYLLGGGVVLGAVAMIEARLRPIVLALAIGLASLATTGYLPYPFVIALLPFAALVVGGALDLAGRAALGARFGIDGVGPGRVGRLSAGVLSGAIAGVLAIIVIPTWIDGVAAAATVDADASVRNAEEWVHANIDDDATIVVDNAIWLDLLKDGRDQEDVIWFYKLDLDPEVSSKTGWEDVDYAVLFTQGATTAPELPILGQVLQNSQVVARFGEGHLEVEIYEVTQ